MRDLLAPSRCSVKVVHVSQRAELDDVNALRLEPCVESFLLEVWMHFHLVDGGDLRIYESVEAFRHSPLSLTVLLSLISVSISPLLKLDTPIALTLPSVTSFSMARHVST